MMATSTTTLQALLIIIVLLPSSILQVSSAQPPASYHFDLVHVDANGNFTREELIQRAAIRTCLKEATLAGTDASADASTKCSSSEPIMAADAITSEHEYLMELEIGTPAKPFMAVADTGSGLTWVKDDVDNQQRRCTKTASTTFDTTKCKEEGHGCRTCREQKCIFEKKYGSEKKAAQGFMGTDMMTLPVKEGFWSSILRRYITGKPQVVIPIGCVDCSAGKCTSMLPRNASGIVGLSRAGLTSLWSNLSRPVSKFSYCLGNPEGKSHLWFGDACLTPPAAPTGATVQTTPLVDFKTIVPAIVNPDDTWAHRYYVELDSISVGGSFFEGGAVPKTKETLRSKTGKPLMFLDTGLSSTLLEKELFQVLLNLLLEKKNGLRKIDDKSSGKHCFQFVNKVSSKMPDIVLHFTDGARMSLPVSKSDKDDTFCLAFLKEGNEKLRASGLGNFQQQNIHMLYDLDVNKLSFTRVDDCSKL